MSAAFLAMVVAPAIVGGTPAADDAAVALVDRRLTCGEIPRVRCSGVLIAPRVVLTAAHCTEPLARGELMEVYVGADLSAGGQHRVVVAWAAHPELDVGVVRLAEPFEGVTPLALSAIDFTVDEAARAVGFGSTAPGETPDGVRREALMRVASVADTEFTTAPDPGMTCDADSGGPVFVRGALVGVTSAGDGACATSATNVRVRAAVDDLIDPFVAETAGSPEGRPEGTIAPEDICAVACTSDDDCPAALLCLGSPGGVRRCGRLGGDAIAFQGICETGFLLWSHGDDACRCAVPCEGGLPPPMEDGCCAVTPAHPRGWNGALVVAVITGILRSYSRLRSSKLRRLFKFWTYKS